MVCKFLVDHVVDESGEKAFRNTDNMSAIDAMRKLVKSDILDRMFTAICVEFGPKEADEEDLEGKS